VRVLAPGALRHDVANAALRALDIRGAVREASFEGRRLHVMLTALLSWFQIILSWTGAAGLDAFFAVNVEPARAVATGRARGLRVEARRGEVLPQIRAMGSIRARARW
jgi:hypothetical protein